MGEVDRRGYGEEQLGGNAGFERTGGDPLGQIAALDQRHREEELSLVLAHVVDGHDVGVREGGGGACLVAETSRFRGRNEAPVEQHFEGHVPAGGELAGPIDDSHAAAADFFEELVAAELAGCRGGGGRRGISAGGSEPLDQIDVGKIVC